MPKVDLVLLQKDNMISLMLVIIETLGKAVLNLAWRQSYQTWYFLFMWFSLLFLWDEKCVTSPMIDRCSIFKVHVVIEKILLFFIIIRFQIKLKPKLWRHFRAYHQTIHYTFWFACTWWRPTTFIPWTSMERPTLTSSFSSAQNESVTKKITSQNNLTQSLESKLWKIARKNKL